MEYSRIIAITGLPGLFELISSKSDGGIVKSLEDKSTRFVSSRVHQFSHLESIEVYTTRYNVNLVEVLQAMGKGEEKLPDEKSSGELKSYFEKVYPELDHSRVYSSDLKKMVKWFSILKANDVEIKLSEPQVAGEEPDGETADTEPAEQESPKKSKAKTAPEAEKTVPKKSAPSAGKEEPNKEAPVKKPVAKAKEEQTKKVAPKKTASKETEETKKPAAKAAPKKSAGKK